MAQNLAAFTDSPKAAFQVRMEMALDDLNTHPMVDEDILRTCASVHDITLGENIYECPIAMALWSGYMRSDIDSRQAMLQHLNNGEKAWREYQRLRAEAPV